jgi:hypothetical protein
VPQVTPRLAPWGRAWQILLATLVKSTGPLTHTNDTSNWALECILNSRLGFRHFIQRNLNPRFWTHTASYDVSSNITRALPLGAPLLMSAAVGARWLPLPPSPPQPQLTSVGQMAAMSE